MKHYLHSLLIIVLAILFVSLLPAVLNFTENFLLSLQTQVPVNNANVAGIQKYSIPPRSKGIHPPDLSARATLVLDLNTDSPLFAKNADSRFPIASTTKIMTALVGSSYFAQNAVLTVKNAAKVAGVKVGFFSGENLTFRSTLYGLLLNSGNDASYVLAENYPGGVNNFVEAMNKKAQELNLTNTHFDNPAGFDSPTHFSSATDLAVITKEALKNPNLARIFATKETEVTSLDRTQKHQLKNLNKLLSQVAGVLGVKTGYTEAAKENLVGLVERGGHKILTVVLGSDDRFGETTNLIEWTFQNFIWLD